MDYRFLTAPNKRRVKKRGAIEELSDKMQSQRLKVGSKQAGPLASVLGTFAQLKY